MAVSFQLASHPKEAAIKDLDQMWREAVDHPIAVDWRNNADLAYKFREGDQWTDSEKQTLKDRNQAAIVENEVHAVIERLKGQILNQRTTIKFIGRNTPDDPLADLQTDLHRHIDQINGFEFAEGEAVDDMLVSGIGVVEVGIETNALGQQQVVLREEDPFTIFKDPFSRRYDWNEDARYICRAKWIDILDAERKWPEKRMALRQCLEDSSQRPDVLSIITPEVQEKLDWNFYFERTKRRLRPVEIWYKRRSRVTEVLTPSGVSLFIQEIGRKEVEDQLRGVKGTVVRTAIKQQMWVAVFCGQIVLDGPKPSPFRHNRFPFVPYFAYRKKNGEPQGHAWKLIDPQREINARRSRALYMLNNRQTIYEENAIRDEAELAGEMARADGQIKIQPGKFDKFAIRENADISQGNLAMLQESKVAVRRISGEDQFNPSPEVRSGVGIQRIQAVGQSGLLPLFRNVRQSRRLKARLVYELIKQFYTGEQVFQITDDPNIARTVRITNEEMQAIKERIYDMIPIDDVFDESTNQEQIREIVNVFPQVAQLGPGPMKLLIGMSQIRRKEELLQMVDAMNQPPPPDARVSLSLQWNEMTQTEKAFWAVKLGMTELAQALQQEQGQPANVTQNQTELVKKAMESQTKITEAELRLEGDRMKADVSDRKAAIDNLTKVNVAEQQRERVSSQSRSK